MNSNNSSPSPHTRADNDVSSALSYKYLPDYAKYLLKNKLTDFVHAQITLSKEVNLPLLRLFENVPAEELMAIGLSNTKELLRYCAENKASHYIHITTQRWINNQLPVISKSHIAPADIALVSYIRRNVFRQFIKCYTSDEKMHENVLKEIDWFIAQSEAAAIKAFFEMQQQLFSQAQSLSHTGNWRWDLKTKELFWSDEVYRIYELEPQSPILSERIRSFNHPDDMEVVDKNMQLSMETLQPHDFFYRIVLKTGAQKILHAKGEVRLDSNGMPIEMFGTLQDITEQKQKEKGLEASRRFAEKITDVSPCVIAVYNISSGNYLFVNKGVTKLLGYEPGEFYRKGRSFFDDLLHEDDVNAFKAKNVSIIADANLQTSAGEEPVAHLRYRLKHKDGSYRWIQTFTTVFNRGKNNIAEDMLNVSIDVTESHLLTLQLQQIHEEIKIKELQHQRMISEVEDYAIILMDKDGFIQNWNKGAEKIKGYSASEIIGKNFRIFYRTEDRERKLPESLIEEAVTKGKASHEGWRVRKDGTMFWGNIVITALHDESNNLIGFSKVTRNLTEKKFAEDKLREYADRIAKHNQELQRINKDLDSFTYMASHDLQEPLRKIRTFCNIILSKAQQSFTEDIKGYFERVINSVARMQTLIDSLLNYSRATTTQIFLQPVKLSLIIDEVLKDLAEVIEEKKVRVICNDLPTINIERLQFHQLFFNLIENAIKYRREDVTPEINIDAAIIQHINEHGENALFHRITVNDNGIGFEQQYAESIFMLFQRLHGRSEYSGTGIGLAICKKIVENHKGIITAESEPGKGSTFIIELPEDTESA